MVRERGQITQLRGRPCMVVSDNGPELSSNAILKWQEDRKIDWRLHRARKADAKRFR